jgi:hypothetical protein
MLKELRIPLSLLLVVWVTSTACGSPSGLDETVPTDGDLTVELSLSKDTLLLGDTVDVTATVTNVSSRTLQFSVNDCPLGTWLEDDEGPRYGVTVAICESSERVVQLAPQQVHRYARPWAGIVFDLVFASELIVPPGTYLLAGYFSSLEISTDAEPIPLVVVAAPPP